MGPISNELYTNTNYIDGLKLRMRTWKRHSTRAKLKNCILPAFRNLECVPPPRMKLFGNQQLECLQGHMFFSRQKHIYILDPPSHHKKGSLPHNFHSFSNFSGYLEVLGIRMYLFENIRLFFVHFAGLGKDSMKSFNEPTGSPKALLLAFPIR